jgi:hypothetical protein
MCLDVLEDVFVEPALHDPDDHNYEPANGGRCTWQGLFCAADRGLRAKPDNLSKYRTLTKLAFSVNDLLDGFDVAIYGSFLQASAEVYLPAVGL